MNGLAGKSIVTDVEQVKENIERYQADLRYPGLVARMSRHPVWYAVRDDDGHWRFAPSKFIGYADISGKEYLSSYDRKDGRETERVLSEWFEPVPLDSALGRQLEAELRRFFAKHRKMPNKLRRINVLKDELGNALRDHPRRSALEAPLNKRISIDAKVCGGRPCIKGTRVRVSDILEMISEGASPAEIVEGYPYLDEEDIAAALAYAARAVDHRVVKAA
jgi:uncharacterized protein (DUF433 family)